MRRRSGFTLIEVLLAVSLTAIIALSVYSMFSSSISVMARISHTSPDEDSTIFSEKLDRRLQNMIRYKTIPFTGNKQETSFAAFLPELQSPQIGRLTLSFAQGKLNLIEQTLNDLHKDKPGHTTVLVSSVSGASFSYYVYDSQLDQYGWFEEYAGDKIPSAIRIQLEFTNGRKKTELIHTAILPLGE